MSFPQTRKTLIFRLATKGSEGDWQQFLDDYWLPVCRFAQQRADLQIEDAEDVAAETFEVVLRNRLLESWFSNRSSKLRTLLCTVVRHILANRARVRKGRIRLLRKTVKELLGRVGITTIKTTAEEIQDSDIFYGVWLESILLEATQSLMRDYEKKHRTARFRVLHGRVCEGLTTAQVSSSLGIKPAKVRKYYNAACSELGIKLKGMLEEHVRRYCAPDDADEELDAEWNRIAQYLTDHGGVERAIENVYKHTELVETADRRDRAIDSTVRRLTEILPKNPEPETED